MQIATTIQQVREYLADVRKRGRRVGLVPTMGALHAGHVSLIDAAVKQTDCAVVSIFVNPTQFAPSEDLDKYPCDLEADSRICQRAGAALVFAPSAGEMYPAGGSMTWVNVEGLTDGLCGSSRPGHFRGVTTVCAKLFNIVSPDVAFFGQKDAQQAIVIKRMVADLNIPLEIAICPTVRADDGLAMSSRNRFLSPAERSDAVLLFKALRKCRELILAGTDDCGDLIRQMRDILGRSAVIEPEYINIVDAETLDDVDRARGRILVALAVTVGTTRLIDNILLDLNETQPTI